MKRFQKLITPLVIAVVSVLGVYSLTSANKTPETAPKTVTEQVKPPEPAPYVPDTNKIFYLVNIERAKAGLGPLTRHVNLDKSATDKCNDMVARNYWAHSTPDGQRYNVFINKYTGKHLKDGENLARSYSDDTALVKGWMDSPTHRAAILDPAYIYVGYAACRDEQYKNYGQDWKVVQHFYQ